MWQGGTWLPVNDFCCRKTTRAQGRTSAGNCDMGLLNFLVPEASSFLINTSPI